MAKTKTRGRGKVKDKWKEKRWVTVLAPKEFENKPIAYIPITSDNHAISRSVVTSLFDIYQKDPQQYSINLQFQITNVSSNSAATLLKGHEYSREYLRSLVRRGSSTLSFIDDYSTKDNYLVRIYLIAFAQGKLNSSRKHEIRLIAHKIFLQKCQSMSYSELCQDIINEKIASEIFNETKKIKFLRKVAIRKTKLIKIPEDFKPPIAEPIVEEPEPTVEEPTVEEPTVEEPTVEEPTVEEP
ncbi:MAG: hypothetical protein CMO13_00040, partial [Thaumarchaeota archaeon]|nr:hypothetical protein [Nitrososphaerota archaeon]